MKRKFSRTQDSLGGSFDGGHADDNETQKHNKKLCTAIIDHGRLTFALQVCLDHNFVNPINLSSQSQEKHLSERLLKYDSIIGEKYPDEYAKFISAMFQHRHGITGHGTNGETSPPNTSLSSSSNKMNILKIMEGGHAMVPCPYLVEVVSALGDLSHPPIPNLEALIGIDENIDPDDLNVWTLESIENLYKCFEKTCYIIEFALVCMAVKQEEKYNQLRRKAINIVNEQRKAFQCKENTDNPSATQDMDDSWEVEPKKLSLQAHHLFAMTFIDAKFQSLKDILRSIRRLVDSISDHRCCSMKKLAKMIEERGKDSGDDQETHENTDFTIPSICADMFDLVISIIYMSGCFQMVWVDWEISLKATEDFMVLPEQEKKLSLLKNIPQCAENSQSDGRYFFDGGITAAGRALSVLLSAASTNGTDSDEEVD